MANHINGLWLGLTKHQSHIYKEGNKAKSVVKEICICCRAGHDDSSLNSFGLFFLFFKSFGIKVGNMQILLLWLNFSPGVSWKFSLADFSMIRS